MTQTQLRTRPQTAGISIRGLLIRLAVSVLSVVFTIGGLEAAFYVNRRLDLVHPPNASPLPHAPLEPRLQRLMDDVAVDQWKPRESPLPVTASDDLPDRAGIESSPRVPFVDSDGAPLADKRTVVTLRASRSRRVLYQAAYSTDPFGLRTTIHPASGSTRDRFLASLGCSFTFGEGVEDAETFPSRVASLLPPYRVYNFGILGSSPSEMLEHQLRGRDFRRNKAIREPSGYVFFTFIDDHVARVQGTMRYLGRNTYERKRPSFRIVNGRLIYEGAFADAHPYWTWLASQLSKSELWQFLRVDLPPASEGTMRLIAKIFAALQKQAEQNFNALKTYVIIFPGQSEHASRLTPYLDQEGVPYLDYSPVDVSRILGENAFIADGKHPSRETYRLLAELLVRDLRDRHVVD